MGTIAGRFTLQGVRQRIGFLGGTFDPPHRGHIELARRAGARLGLDRVLLAPVGAQPLKAEDAPLASYAQRLRMVELAVADGGLEASDIDAPRPDGRPNYSAETLARVRELFPAAEIFFILGADAFAGLRKWSQPERLLEQCELVVASRPGLFLPQDGNDLLEWMPVGTRFLGTEEMRVRDEGRGTRHQAPGNRDQGPGTGDQAPETAEARVFLAGAALVRVYLLDDLAEDIAATELRAQLGRGEGFGWLPGGELGAVAEYVREQGLYL